MTAYRSPSVTRISGILRIAPLRRPRVDRMITGTPRMSQRSAPSLAS